MKRARLPVWVKTGRTRIEYMFSAVHPITDVGQYNRPQTEQRTAVAFLPKWPDQYGDTWQGLYRFHRFLKSAPTPPPVPPGSTRSRLVRQPSPRCRNTTRVERIGVVAIF